MLDPIRRLLAEASKAKQTRAFWQAATDILSEWAGGARVQLTYKGLNESGTLEAGAPGQEGETFLTDYHDAEGRHVSARFEGLPTASPATYCAPRSRSRRTWPSWWRDAADSSASAGSARSWWSCRAGSWRRRNGSCYSATRSRV